MLVCFAPLYGDYPINCHIIWKTFLVNMSVTTTMTAEVIYATKEDEHKDVCAKLPTDIGTDYTFKRKIVWFNAIGFLIMHLAAVYGLYLAFFVKGRTFAWGK